MSIRSFTQKIISLININSSNTQIINNNPNKEVIKYLLEKEFNRIDILLEKNSIEESEVLLENIAVRKEELTNDDELKLLEYKSLISISKKEFKKVKLYIERMERFIEYENYKDSVLLNLAIHKNDIKVFNELKSDWNRRNIDKKIIIQNEMIFWFHVHEYQKVIEIFKENKDSINSEDILFLVGQAYINLDLNEDAIKVFKSCTQESDRKKLWVLIGEFRNAINKYVTIDIFKNKENIQEFIEQSSQIDKRNLCLNDERNFVLVQARIKLFFDLNLCKEFILELKGTYNFVELDILYLDVLEQLNKFEEAEKIYENLMKQDIENINTDLVVRGILIKYNLKKYDEVKELYEKYINFSNNDSLITYYYGLALIKIFGVKEARIIIKDRVLENDEFSFLLLSELNIDNDILREAYLDKLKSIIDKDSYFILYIADIYYRLDKLCDAFNILIQGASSNKVFFKRLISLASKTEINSKENNKILNIYMDNYRDETDNYICEYVYIILVRKKKYISAQALAQKMYEEKRNIYWANNYLEMKFANDELENITELIKILENGNEACYIINAAMGHMKLGSYTLCKELCFKAYSKMKNDEEFVLLKIGSISLELEQFLESKYKKEILDRDIIVCLADESGEFKNYCFSNENMFSCNTKIRGNIELRNLNDDIFIETLGKEKGEKITVDGTEFTIIEKVNKYSYMFREGISYLLEHGETQVKKIIIKEENGKLDIEGLIHEMKGYEEAQKKNMKMYLEGKIPFFLICREREKLPVWLERLSLLDEYGIFAGSMKNTIKKGETIVVSLNGIFMLYYKDLLKSYIEDFNVIVGEELLKELIGRKNLLIKTIMVKTRTMGLIDGKLFMNEESIDSKRKTIKTYEEIIKILENAKKVKISLVQNELIAIGEGIIPIADIECIEIAKEYKATLILEDYVLSSIAYSLNSGMKIDSIANITISMILANNNIKRNMTSLKLLIKERYRFVFSAETLENFIRLFEVSDKWRVKKFKEIINLLIEYDFEKYYAYQLFKIAKKLEKNDLKYIEKVKIINILIREKYLPKCFKLS